jgi:hypothetical protein
MPHPNYLSMTSLCRTLLTAALIAYTLLLGGCASLTPEQCAHADWRQIGYADGVKGLSGAQIEEHARACAPQGIKPNLDAYLAGRSQGLVSYCQPQNGFDLGRRGVSQVISDCPDNLKWAFQEEFNKGQQVYAIESELNTRSNQLQDVRHKIHHNDDRIGEIRMELAKRDLNPERRIALLNEYNRLVDQKEPLVRSSLELEGRVGYLQRRLNDKLRELGR